MRVSKSSAYFLLCMMALIPVSYFAFQIVAAGAGDNTNYLNAFEGIGLGSVAQGYLQFRMGSDGFEPIAFLYFYFLAKLNVSYELSILLKNILFNASLSALLVTFLGKNKMWLFLLTVFFAVSQYTLALHAELHRLALAFTLVNFSLIAWIKSRRRFTYFLVSLSTLSHIQIGLFLLAAWRVILSRTWILIASVIFISIVTAFILPQMVTKIQFYRGDPVGGFSQTIIFWAFSTVFVALYLRRHLLSFFIFSSVVAAFSMLVGGGRLNILLILFFVGIVSHGVYERNISRYGKLTFMASLVLFIPYDLYRSIIFFHDLMGEGNW